MDGSDPGLLKSAAELITKPLTIVFNRSISRGILPHEFKVTKRVPLHKGGSYYPHNFCPISLLPSLSLILENAIHQQLCCYLNNNGLLSDHQLCFQPLHSTSNCLTEIVDFLSDDNYEFKAVNRKHLSPEGCRCIFPQSYIAKDEILWN